MTVWTVPVLEGLILVLSLKCFFFASIEENKKNEVIEKTEKKEDDKTGMFKFF